MLRDAEPVAFVHTVDLDRARPFYVDTLGLELVEQTEFALVLRSGSTTIRVTPVESHVPSAATVLGWVVPDVAADLGALTGRGIVAKRFDGMVQDDDGVWTSPSGARIAWFADPDGNVLSVTQL